MAARRQASAGRAHTQTNRRPAQRHDYVYGSAAPQLKPQEAPRPQRTARMHHIETMEAHLEKLKAENDALETSINTSIDLNKIYEIATKELGMVYAKKNQVLLYDKTESEYVRQYEDIPEH